MLKCKKVPSTHLSPIRSSIEISISAFDFCRIFAKGSREFGALGSESVFNTRASSGSNCLTVAIKDNRTPPDRLGSMAAASNFAHISFKFSRVSSIAASRSGKAIDGLTSS